MTKVQLTFEQVRNLVERSVSKDASITLLLEYGEGAEREIARLLAVIEELEDDGDGLG